MTSFEYRIEFSIQRASPDEDFEEIGFGSSGAWDRVDEALHDMSSIIQNREWETDLASGGHWKPSDEYDAVGESLYDADYKESVPGAWKKVAEWRKKVDEREAQIAVSEIKEAFHVLYCSPHTGIEEEWACEAMVKEVVERIRR